MTNQEECISYTRTRKCLADYGYLDYAVNVPMVLDDSDKGAPWRSSCGPLLSGQLTCLHRKVSEPVVWPWVTDPRVSRYVGTEGSYWLLTVLERGSPIVTGNCPDDNTPLVKG